MKKATVVILAIATFFLILLFGGCMSKEDKEAIQQVKILIENNENAETILEAYDSLTVEQKKYLSFSKDIEAAKEVNTLIASYGIIPTQTEYESAISAINKLKEKQKKYIVPEDYISKFANVDLNKLRKISEDIESINNSTPFSKIIEINEKIENLTREERQFFDLSKVKKAMELSNIEKSAVSAVQYIIKCLKNPNSIALKTADVVDDTKGKTKYYLVKITYTATNSFGGTTSDYSLQTINTEFENPWYPLTILTGQYEAALKFTSATADYYDPDKNPVSLDPDKILYFAKNQ